MQLTKKITTYKFPEIGHCLSAKFLWSKILKTTSNLTYDRIFTWKLLLIIIKSASPINNTKINCTGNNQKQKNKKHFDLYNFKFILKYFTNQKNVYIEQKYYMESKKL